MKDRLAIEGETGGSVRHQPLALGGADRLTQVCLGVQAIIAFPAFRGVERDNMITRLERGNASAYLQHNTGAFMAEDRREQPFRVSTRKGEFISMADTGGLDFHQHFTGLWTFKVNLHNLKRFASFESNSGAGFHSNPPMYYYLLETALHGR